MSIKGSPKPTRGLDHILWQLSVWGGGRERRGKWFVKSLDYTPASSFKGNSCRALLAQAKENHLFSEGHPSDRLSRHIILRLPTFQPRRDQNNRPHPTPPSAGCILESQGEGFYWESSVESFSELYSNELWPFPREWGKQDDKGGRSVTSQPECPSQSPGLVPETHRRCPCLSAVLKPNVGLTQCRQWDKALSLENSKQKPLTATFFFLPPSISNVSEKLFLWESMFCWLNF